MCTRIKSIGLCVFILMSTAIKLVSQDDFFTVVGVSANFYDSDHYSFDGSFEYQYLLRHDEWSSWDATVSGLRRFGKFDLKGALFYSRTRDTEFNDLSEFRPYFAVYYHWKVDRRITLDQYVRSEYRNLYSSENNDTDHRIRLRYAIALKVPLGDLDDYIWRFRPKLELYILNAQNIEERFINKNTIQFAFERKMLKNSTMTLGYKMTSLNDKFNTNAFRGHEMSLQFGF